MKNGKLRILSDGLLSFYCKGCGCYHWVNTNKNKGKPCWDFNGDYEKPTFSPSILVRTGHYVPEHKNDDCWCTYNAEHPDDQTAFKCSVCHSFVRDGKIQYLSDCTHELAGQTIEMEDEEK